MAKTTIKMKSTTMTKQTTLAIAMDTTSVGGKYIKKIKK